MFRRKSARTESDSPVTDPTRDPTARDIAHIRDYALRMRLAAEAQDSAAEEVTSAAQDSTAGEDGDIVAEMTTDSALVAEASNAPGSEEVAEVKVVETIEPEPEADVPVAVEPQDAQEQPVVLPKAHELVDVPPALAQAARQVQSSSRSSFESRLAAAAETPAPIERPVVRPVSKPRPSVAPALESHLPASPPMSVVRPEPVNAADDGQSMRLSQIGTGTISGESESDDSLSIRNVVIQGVTFRAPKAISPGTIRQLRMHNDQTTLNSKIRVVSCRLRGDGSFDIKAEFF